MGTENLFQPSRQTGLFNVILAKRILRARISRTEFVVLVEGKPFISCILSFQAPCLVLKTGRK